MTAKRKTEAPKPRPHQYPKYQPEPESEPTADHVVLDPTIRTPVRSGLDLEPSWWRKVRDRWRVICGVWRNGS